MRHSHRRLPKPPRTGITHPWSSLAVVHDGLVCRSPVCIERRIRERGDITIVYDDQGNRQGIVL
jgi:hypothetical protein